MELVHFFYHNFLFIFLVKNLIKDIVTELNNEGAISSDKIGVSITYWAFGGNIAKQKKVKLEELEELIKKETKKLDQIKKQIEQQTSLRIESESRELKIKKIQELKDEIEILKKKTSTLKENDPLIFYAMSTIFLL